MKVTTKKLETVMINRHPVHLYPTKKYDVVRVQGSRVLLHVAENLYTWISIKALKAA